MLLGMLFAPAAGYAETADKQQLRSLSAAFRDVAKQVSPAVVYISTEQTVKGGRAQVPEEFREFFGDEFFRRFFDTPEQREFKRRGLGSGFIVSKDGYILTNSHVVEEADKIQVTLPDKSEYDAEVVGVDSKSDVAVIKIEGDDFPVVQLGDSDAIEVGDWAVAIGTPFGLSQTVTAGIISASGRANIGIVDYEDFIQTDAAINPGNSGGPLVNIEGEVIGINTAIFSRTGGYQGIGFAIPINMAEYIMQSLISEGKVVRGWLGVMIQPVTQEIANSFGLEEAVGTLVADVLTGGPAEEAGFKRGDIIIEFDGQPIDGPNTLRNIVAQTEVGKVVDVVVIRDGKEQTITVKIGEQEAGLEASRGPEPEAAEEAGITVQELTPEIAGQLGYEDEQGVIISEVTPGSPAAEAGLRRGDLIKEVNRQTIRSVSDYRDAMKSVDDDEGFLLLIRRGDNTVYVVVEAD